MTRLKLFDAIEEPFVRPTHTGPDLFVILGLAVLVIVIVAVVLLVLRKRRRGKK